MQKKTPLQTESKPEYGKSSGGPESPRSPQTPKVSPPPTPVPSNPKPKPKPKPAPVAEIQPARTERKGGGVTLVFTPEQCGRIISLSKGGKAPTLSTNFSVEYSVEWHLITFALSEEMSGRETWSFEVRKPIFVKSELSWGSGGVGSPNCKNKSHGLSPQYFKMLVAYAHSMIADELRGD